MKSEELIDKELLEESFWNAKSATMFEREKREQFVSGTYNILILEDDRTLSDAIIAHLTHPQFSNATPSFVVYQAFTYDEAVELAKMVKMDIFLLDVYLSQQKSFWNKSGLSYAKLLKGDQKRPDYYKQRLRHNYQYGSPIIFLTSEKDPHKQVKVHDEVSPQTYLKKPASMEEVQNTVVHASHNIGIKRSSFQLKNIEKDTFSKFYCDNVIWVEFDQSTTSASMIYYNAYQKSKKATILKEKQCKAFKGNLAVNTGFIDGLPRYLINPKYITGYDDATNELILTYEDGVEVSKLKFKDIYDKQRSRIKRTPIIKEKRIPISEKYQMVVKIIAERMKWK